MDWFWIVDLTKLDTTKLDTILLNNNDFSKLKEIRRTIKGIKPKLGRMREEKASRTANIIVIRDTVAKNGIPT